MNEKLKQYFANASNFWKSRSKKQKTIFLSSLALIVLLASVITFLQRERKWSLCTAIYRRKKSVQSSKIWIPAASSMKLPTGNHHHGAFRFGGFAESGPGG